MPSLLLPQTTPAGWAREQGEHALGPEAAADSCHSEDLHLTAGKMEGKGAQCCGSQAPALPLSTSANCSVPQPSLPNLPAPSATTEDPPSLMLVEAEAKAWLVSSHLRTRRETSTVTDAATYRPCRARLQNFHCSLWLWPALPVVYTCSGWHWCCSWHL